jgi:hypothetical protein
MVKTPFQNYTGDLKRGLLNVCYENTPKFQNEILRKLLRLLHTQTAACAEFFSELLHSIYGMGLQTLRKQIH